MNLRVCRSLGKIEFKRFLKATGASRPDGITALRELFDQAWSVFVPPAFQAEVDFRAEDTMVMKNAECFAHPGNGQGRAHRGIRVRHIRADRGLVRCHGTGLHADPGSQPVSEVQGRGVCRDHPVSVRRKGGSGSVSAATLHALREKERKCPEELILLAARKLFAEKDFRSVTVREIARAVQVSPGTIYRYYESLDDLFLDVFFAGARGPDRTRRWGAQRRGRAVPCGGSASSTWRT